MQKRLTCIVVSIAALLGTSSVAAQTIKLLCAAADGRFPKVFDIDFGARTVNGFAAEITDSEIKWQSWIPATKNAPDHNLINRLNGQFSSWYAGPVPSQPPPAIVCEKAPAAKF